MLDRPPRPGFLAVALLAGLASCAAPPRPAVGPPAPETTRPVAAAGTLYQVLDSDVTVRVYRDGPLAELGHNHVIASTGLTGQIELRQPLAASTLALELPLGSLVVDDQARREAAGGEFPGTLSQPDREGTRANMLGTALLDAAHFPVMLFEGLAIDGESPGFRVTTRVSIAGRQRDIVVPVKLEVDGDTLTASGSFTVTHAELGLSPFSVALGALRVREDIQVDYRLSAHKTGAGAQNRGGHPGDRR
jgi:polyisoprenoid-binding protein YceI